MLRVCVVGANGFLGLKFLERYQDEFDLVACDLDGSFVPGRVPFEQLDLTKPAEVSSVLEGVNPDVVLLTAAMTDVDGCERNPELAFQVNRDGPAAVARACRKLNARLVFLSTDFVFDGEKGEQYVEEDVPNPVSVYGRTKLEAEEAIRDSGCDALVCRTSVLYGWQHPGQNQNFASWLVSKLGGGETVRIVTTQYNTPTFGDNLAECLGRMVNFTGQHTYHTVGSSCVSRYEFALELAGAFGFPRENVVPIDEFPQDARRPAYGCLSNAKASRDFGVHFSTVLEGFEAMRGQSPRG
ncbi:MAG: dTDP-4-dehydrorhamnose reductase [Promethearchaeota archaeon]